MYTARLLERQLNDILSTNRWKGLGAKVMAGSEGIPEVVISDLQAEFTKATGIKVDFDDPEGIDDIGADFQELTGEYAFESGTPFMRDFWKITFDREMSIDLSIPAAYFDGNMTLPKPTVRPLWQTWSDLVKNIGFPVGNVDDVLVEAAAAEYKKGLEVQAAFDAGAPGKDGQ